MEVNSKNRIIKKLYSKKAESGSNIILTINIELQKYISNLLPEKIRAAIIVTDPRNSEIISMISHPSYNSNLFVEGITSKDFNNLINNNDRPLINRVSQGTYPPASTVKPYIAIAALSSKFINKNTFLYDPGWWKLPNYNKKYRDWKRSGHGYIDIIKSLEESSDTFFYRIAYDMGIDNIFYWMNKFGYGQSTGIDLYEEHPGHLPNREWKKKRFQLNWYQGDTIPIGIGQGYWTATPLQMNKAIVTLINNGVIRKPHLLLFYKNESKTYRFNNLTDNIFLFNEINKKHWEIVKKGLYGVAHKKNGTSYKYFKNTSYKIAAKSGTAQIHNLKENEIYDSKKINKNLLDHKLLTAYAPYHDPTIAISIILENGGENKISIGNIILKIINFILLNKINGQK